MLFSVDQGNSRQALMTRRPRIAVATTEFFRLKAVYPTEMHVNLCRIYLGNYLIPALLCPALLHPAQPALLCPALLYPILPCPILHCSVLICSFPIPYPALTYLFLSKYSKPCPILPCYCLLPCAIPQRYTTSAPQLHTTTDTASRRLQFFQSVQ